MYLIRKVFAKIYRFLQVQEMIDRYTYYRKKYKIDKDFRFNGHEILFYGDGAIIAGAGSYIGRYSSIQAATGYSVKIGNNCQISHNVRIYTTTNVTDDDWEKSGYQLKHGNVEIGNYVWIGVNVFIGPDVKIGNNSVIGANAVVTKDIPPFSIAAGIPAKVIREKKLNS